MLSLPIFAAGCATTEPVYVYETVEVVKDRYVAIPAVMTQPVEIVSLTDDFDLIDLGVAYKLQRTRAMQCNMMLSEIASLGAE